jgi:lysophospholipase L1-like esterase
MERGGLKRNVLALIALAFLAGWVASDAYGVWTAPRVRTLWGPSPLYRDANKSILASHEQVDVVFMGDSITEFWKQKDPDFFRKGYVNRGIARQTTPQMLARFEQDVVSLRPHAVHILGGTNDITGNTGPMTLKDTTENIEAMSAIARAHDIRVFLAAVPPRPAFVAQTKALNSWLRAYADTSGATFVDYTSALDDGRGAFKPGLSADEVHPNAQGYAAMDKAARAVMP